MSTLPSSSQNSDFTQATRGNMVMSTTPQGKEREVVQVATAEFPLQEVGQEIELSREVISSGVQAHPAETKLPQVVVDQGVVSVGDVGSTGQSAGGQVILPLTDEQIAKALHASVTSSVRWLAEWCVRKMKMVHRTMTGKNNTKMQ
jgi:hypothetical protein